MAKAQKEAETNVATTVEQLSITQSQMIREKETLLSEVVCARMHSCVHVCVYVCGRMHSCVHVCVYVCGRMHTCVHVCLRACVPVCSCTCIHG